VSETLSILPLAFWVVVAVLFLGAVHAVRHVHDASGVPMLAVLGTVAAWYVGDAFYNDYANNHAKLFTTDVLRDAWWQVAWFLLVFLVATPSIHRWLNASYLHRGSGMLQLIKHGVGQPVFQRQLSRLFYGCAIIWAILCGVAALMLKDQILYFFFPFLGYNASPWSHARVGAGFDFLSIVAVNLQLLIGGIFGVVAALSTNPRIRWLAVGCCLVSWPYFIFGRTRNTMLVVVIPGVLSWVFLRLRGSLLKRGLVLGGCFLLVNAWMGFVIANRSNMSIVDAFKEKGFTLDTDEKVHHEGLNMYEELCWINTFMEQGTYEPNWGARYFAELVNPIPRVLWPGKPLMGIDYAIARGQAGGDANEAGVYATISTGMIGQGVVNFGRVIGPAFAALMMSFWVAILARLDLRIQELGRLPLFATGLFATFNMGRDIGFIALYPFVFGTMVVWWLDHYRARQLHPSSYGARPQRPMYGLKTKSVKMWRMNRKVAGIGGGVRRIKNAGPPATWRKTRPPGFPQSP
jgi:hypothetical protein